jgi:thioredoxin-dependent peroxiredoxin
MIRIGSNAPDFTLSSESGETLSLKDFRGKKVVLYFYPKDDTPGCTREACDFRDNETKFAKLNAVIIGVSADGVESHTRFKTKFGLPFHLLSDSDKKVIKAYGVWKDKMLYGRKMKGIERTTFVIDEQGKISKVFPKVKVDGHIEEILSSLN